MYNLMMDQKKSIEEFKLRVGDLVALSGHGLNSGGIIYRIVEDHPPEKLQEQPKDSRGHWSWRRRNISAKTGKPVSYAAVNGFVYVVPVLKFAEYQPKNRRGKTISTRGRKLVEYRHVETRLRRVDIVELGVFYANFKAFVEKEVKRLSGEDDVEPVVAT